jgi:transposase
LAGDEGIRADRIDEALLELGIRPVVPLKEIQTREKRLVTFDGKAYRRRNIVERLIGWLKEYRRVFSRFEKTAKNFGGIIKMAFIERYLRLCSS